MQPARPRLRFTLFGDFAMAVDGSLVDPTALAGVGKNGLALLKMLALAQGHRLSNDQVYQAFWEDKEEEKAWGSLRKVKSKVNKALDPTHSGQRRQRGEGPVFMVDGTISLCKPFPCPAGEVHTDLADFLRLHDALGRDIERAVTVDPDGFAPAPSRAPAEILRDCKMALDLYGPGLLPADRRSGWADTDVVRGRWQSLPESLARVRLAYAYACASLGQEGWVRGSEHLGQWIAEDEFGGDEQLHEWLMRLHALNGRSQLALRHYRVYERRLQQSARGGSDGDADALAKPSPQTTTLYRAIREERFPPPSGAPMPATTHSPAPNNLPPEETDLIGRETARRDLVPLLRRWRLVTLVGAGGCGKTRLARAVARDLALAPGGGTTFPGGVWHVELADLRLPAGAGPDAMRRVLLGAIFAARGHDGVAPGATWDELRMLLGDQQTLLVLDNCAHLLPDLAQAVAALLAACPSLHVLATSRQELGVIADDYGVAEKPYRVPSLDVPPAPVPGAAIMPMMVAGVAAVTLLVRELQRHDPDFALTVATAPAVVAICRDLDGLPLALVLAAAQLPTLQTVTAIAANLDRAPDLLVGGAVQGWQRTVTAAIARSDGLLDEVARTLLYRLAVFRGSWTEDAARAVCAEPPIDERTVSAPLRRLVDLWLVERAAPPPSGEERRVGARYRLLETVRQYAWDRLMASNVENRYRQRHAEYYLTLAEEFRSGGAEVERPAGWRAGDHPNLRAALEWALARPDPQLGLQLAGALWWPAWDPPGDWSALREPLERALARAAPVAPVVGVPALTTAGMLARRAGDIPAAAAHHRAALARCAASGIAGADRAVRMQLARDLVRLERYGQALEAYDGLLTLARAAGGRRAERDLLMLLGALLLNEVDPGREVVASRRQGGAYHERALALSREFGDPIGSARSLVNLGYAALLDALDAPPTSSARATHLALAHEWCGEATATLLPTGDDDALARAKHDLAAVELLRGDVDRAAELFSQSLAHYQARGARLVGIAYCLDGLAGVAGMQGHSRRAAALLGAADGIRESLDYRLTPAEHRRRAWFIASARVRWEEEFDRHRLAGRGRPWMVAVATEG